MDLFKLLLAFFGTIVGVTLAIVLIVFFFTFKFIGFCLILGFIFMYGIYEYLCNR